MTASEGANRRAAAGVPWWPALVVVGAVGAVYANTLANGFVWDDQNLVVGNPAIKGWERVPALFANPMLPGAEYYRPVQALTFVVDHALWGLRPAGYHLTNVLLHAAVAVLLYRLAARLLPGWRAPLFAALLWAVHPVHTEAVAYVSGRTDALGALFMLAALRWSLAPRRALLSLAAFLLALLSRESTVVLVLLLPLVHAAVGVRRGEPSGVRALALRTLPYAGVVAAWLVLRAAAVERTIVHAAAELPLSTRLLTLPRVVLEYLGLLLWPARLHMERDVPPAAAANDPGVLGALVAVLAVAAAVVVLRRRARPVAVGAAWFAVALLPVANLVPLATFLAEHWLYVPSMGIFLAAGWALDHLGARFGTAAAVVAVAALAVGSGTRSVRRNADWRDERTLLEATVRAAPGSARVWVNLGRVYFTAGEPARAKDALARAIALEPDSVRASDAHNLLGSILQHEGRLEEAVREYERAIALNARPTAAYTNLGTALLDLGRLDEARRALEAAVDADPASAVAHMNLGNLHARGGDLAGAMAAYARAVELDPDYAPAHRNLGRVQLLLGRPELAERSFRAALALEPGSAAAQSGLRRARELQGRPGEG